MAEPSEGGGACASWQARQVIGAYHEQQLRLLLECVRDGLARMDRGEIDPFELEDVIHHYTKAARELWKFCGSSGGGWEAAARTLQYLSAPLHK